VCKLVVVVVTSNFYPAFIHHLAERTPLRLGQKLSSNPPPAQRNPRIWLGSISGHLIRLLRRS